VTYSVRPVFGFDWPRFEIVSSNGRRFGKFRTRDEANAYVVKLSRTPLAVPGTVNHELQALADECAALLRLRSFDWKRKKNPEPEPEPPPEDLEIPF